MTLPDLLNMEAKQGDTFPLSLDYLNDDDSPIDVTGYAAEFSIAVRPGGSPSFTYTEDDYITLGGALGTAVISIPPAVTRLWTQRRYWYEISLTDTAGDKVTVLEGRLVVRPEVVLE